MTTTNYKRTGNAIQNTDNSGYQAALKRRQNEVTLQQAYKNIDTLLRKFYQLEANFQNICKRLEKLEEAQNEQK